MSQTLIKNARIVNEGRIVEGDVLIDGQHIVEINSSISVKSNEVKVIDAENKLLMPGIIDDQVHFREPGLTHKATIESESRAAVAGGITSFIEMPNTIPQATTNELIEEKFKLASTSSYANYSFMIGGTNTNLDELLKTDPKKVAAIKLFLGSSTGNMLVDDAKVLEQIFKTVKMLIVTHCEDEATIKKNLAAYIDKYGDDIPVKYHPLIRSEEACYLSSSKTVALAKKTGARLHVYHISTAKEAHKLFSGRKSLKNKKITAEVCVHHLWFDDSDYDKKGTLIKWNPAIKTKADKEGLLKALLNDKIDIIATDHAPHTLTEKQQVYTKAPSGGPLVQHALLAMLELYKKGLISIEKIIEKMCHNPAILFQIEKRGFIKEGYFADLVLVDTSSLNTVTKDTILYKCKWSPFEGTTFTNSVTHTFVNGNLIYNQGVFNNSLKGKRLTFNR
ncbi:MAG: dihydroorotase [Flavobacteriaceae bacterium]|nr:dihydroorotase [Flavobacteriaceae bacterium]